MERSLDTVAVTGTNGKTTTTTLIAAIVAAAGEPSARVTTLGAWVSDEEVSTEATTEAFAATVARARAAGVRTLALETTSEALAQGFARSWPIRVGVFTNLSRDHLNYHGTLEDYLAAKAQLFMSLPEDGGVAVLDAADPASALLDEVTPEGVRRIAYAGRPVAPECASLPLALAASEVQVSRRGTRVRLAPSPLAERLGGVISLSIIGEVHAENALAAALAADALGYPAEAISRGLEGFAGVPGRFQVVCDAPLVVVDFAHTPDALQRTLAMARRLVAGDSGRVGCVFGCGGDRDPGKRPEMGAIAAREADFAIVTTDNPRSEDPDAIVEAILRGTGEGRARILRIPDRADAIAHAIAEAGLRDIVVVAGKGHERTQTVGTLVIPFDDREVAIAACQLKGSPKPT